MFNSTVKGGRQLFRHRGEKDRVDQLREQRQIQKLKNNIFKIEFQPSGTRKTDGNALSINEFEMIAVHEFSSASGKPKKDDLQNMMDDFSSVIQNMNQDTDGSTDKAGFMDYRV